MGSWWRGRAMTWDADAQALEQERQQWISERLSGEAEIIADLAVDPGQAYAEWRREYLLTGGLDALRMMLEYVR